MSLPAPISHFGVHSGTPYSRVTGLPYGTFKVIQSATLALSGKLVALTGGSAKYPYDVQEGEISPEMSLKVSEYPDWLYTLFAGAVPVDNAADSLGAVSTLTNKSGTSVVNATTGIASVGINTGSEADLKYGKYVVVAVSATTVNLYSLSDIDFQRGTAGSFQDGTLVLLAAAVTITASTGSNITGWGLKLTGGSGAIGMTAGDTATFEVRPKNTGSTILTIGAASSTFPEFGFLIYAKKKGTGEMLELDAYRCKGEGVPLHFDKDKYSEADIKVNLMYDSTLDAVARVRRVTPITPY